MARLPRICPPEIPQHIIQRGNNRQVCFHSDRDRSAYAAWLKEYSHEHGAQIHAWVFMNNHVHLLATPIKVNAISSMMQALGRRYVRYFNRAYERSGTLWEGRFRSSLVQSEIYLLRCYRYIEMNPVRANLVSDPCQYHWSSYHCNALGKRSDLCIPHAQYSCLGVTDRMRQQAYRALFSGGLDESMVEEIRSSTNAGLALGNEQFKSDIESAYGRRVQSRRRGRPVIGVR